MPVASLQKKQDILYPATGILTNIEQWDMSLLNCVYTHIQRKLIINDFRNPIDPITQQYKAQVLATTVGKENEEKLYPQSGKPTDVNKWNMSLCSCMFSVLSPKPQTLHVRIAESLNSLREMRNSLCHTETPDMESLVYEEHLTVLKDFINSGLTYIGDVAFETEIKEDMGDIENGRMRCFILADHKHLERSYANDRDINQKLDNIVKEIHRLSQKDQEGMRVLGAKRACLEIKLRFDNAVRMWKFIKTYLSGTLDSFFEVVQELLRTREEFENLEMTVAVPDVIAAFLKSGEAQEIDPISMMCALELLSQRLNSLDEKQQDDSVRKSLELNLTNIQHDRENADIRTGKMEFDKSGVTSLKKKEQVLDEPKTLLEEFYLNKSGQQIMTTLKPEPSEKFFEEINFDEAGKKVKTSIQEEIEKPIEECTVEEAAKRVKTMIQEETEKPIEEYTVHDTGEKVKTTIQEETEKHIEEYTADEAGKTVKPTIQEETEKPIKKYTVHEAGEKVKKTIQEETEKHIEEYTIGEANEKVMASIFKETKMPIEGATIDESEQKVT
ncbi:hypothetical protein MAR_018697 [Mya arenaria]|uniref:DZIP3-like HEPN domain-containing protein n=1 Tax=Mya arenaria TaxID=6604 RepID=A0ABY7EI73_MYAAR|nr:hypothetical protein MAR_018697 [Mya arenaria]